MERGTGGASFPRAVPKCKRSKNAARRFQPTQRFIQNLDSSGSRELSLLTILSEFE